jgi:RNA polymerase sigma-70 factor (ECF subfamily)
MQAISAKEFEKVYKEHYQIVKAVAYKYGMRDGALDDAIQETFIKAYENFHTLKDPKALRGWITTIARNYCLGIHRKAKPEVEISGTDEQSEDRTVIVLESEDMFGNIDFENCITLLQGLIEAHKGEPRASIAKLFYIEKKTIKEICDYLSIKQNTVLSHLRRFRLLVSESMLTLAEEQGLSPY